MTRIVGREAELGEIEAAFDRVPTDGPLGVLIEGPAGIGKSTIWAEAIESARRREWIVLSARPAASESQLALGTIADLLGRVEDAEVAALPPPQRRALAVALLRDDAGGTPPEGRVLGTAVRNLLEGLARRRPVVVAIDDAQWTDSGSAAVLAFALRRVSGLPIALVLARRVPLALPFAPRDLLPAEAWAEIGAGPMSLGAINTILGTRAGTRAARAPSRATLVRIHQASGGNPLFALEIARALDAHGEPPAGESLPVPADIRDLLRERLAALPDGTREVLLDLAVVGTVDPDRLAAMHGGDVGGDLERAIADALVRRDGRSISFAHPLYAAAAEAAATPEQRRAAHERAARTAADVEEEARHRALATEGPDAAVAAALEAAARGGRSRAAPLAAAELLRLSIERTPPAEVEAVARRRVALGEVLKQAGDAPAAIRELERVVAEADAAARAEARLVLAAIRFETDASPAAAVRLAAAAVEDAGGDPAIAAHAYAVLTAVDWQEIGRHAEYLDAAEAAIAKVAEPDPAVEGLIVLARCGEDVRTGHPLNPELVARGLELEELAPAPAVADRFSGSYGTWLKLLGRFDEARVWLERTRQAAIDEGDEGSLAYSLSHLPELEVWTGDWDRAEVIAREHLSVSEASNLESQRLQALYNLALVHVHQGRADARAELDAAIAAATEADDRWMLSGILPILGLLELSLGDAAAAVDPFERAYEIREQLGSDEPRRFGPDLVEALIAVGRIDRAEAVQRELEARIARFDRPSSRATVARSRALLLAAHGRLEEARDALDEALGQHAVALIPFDRARTLLALGQVRRRLRERGAARDAFEEARAELERLGSLPWAARAAAELERTGIRRGAGLDLTETERRVAELAASGLTNREVAAALFMSPKTVDANLGRAYAKLGIRSRAELGAVIARRDAGGSGAQT